MISLFDILSKRKVSIFTGIAVGVFLLGGVLRFCYVWNVGHHPFLNLALPESELFMHDLMARNLIHPKPFPMNAPIYPITVHYLSLIYRLFGEGNVQVYIVNFLLSMSGVWMLAVAGKELFGRMAGVLAGAGMLFYRMNFFYDGLKDGTVLSQFFLVAIIFSLVMFLKKGKPYFYALFLVFALLASSIRVFYLIIIIPVMIFCFIRFRHWRRPFFLIMNIIFILTASWSFVYLRGADSFLNKFSIHFYIGNHAGSNGLMHDVPGMRKNADGFSKDAVLQAYAEQGSTDNLEHYWVRKTFDSYQNDYGGWPKLLARKLFYLTNNFEPHNISSIYYYEKYTSLKYFPRLNFAVLFVLAAVGIVLTFWKRHRPGILLFLPIVVLMAMMLAVFITSRYRMPIVPLLCLYAGFGAQQCALFARQKKFRELGITAMVIAAAAFLTSRPIKFFDEHRDTAFWEGEAKRAQQHDETVAKANEQYYQWDSLTNGQKIELIKQLRVNFMPYKFLEVYDKLLPFAKNNIRLKYFLWEQRALFEETYFNFQKALEIWKQLQQDPQRRAFARQKIDEIRVLDMNKGDGDFY